MDGSRESCKIVVLSPSLPAKPVSNSDGSKVGDGSKVTTQSGSDSDTAGSDHPLLDKGQAVTWEVGSKETSLSKKFFRKKVVLLLFNIIDTFMHSIVLYVLFNSKSAEVIYDWILPYL